MNLLQLPFIDRTRRNHGLEHATIHVLARSHPNKALAGHSDPGGFWLLGDLDSEMIQQAVDEALQRMRAGEQDLAVHPNCGTNFVTAGALAGLAGAASMFGARRWTDKLGRMPLAVMMATMALIVSRPLGRRLQKHVTTSGEMREMEVVRIHQSDGIRPFGMGLLSSENVRRYRVDTQG
jgi:hypothetical protein